MDKIEDDLRNAQTLEKIDEAIRRSMYTTLEKTEGAIKRSMYTTLEKTE
jgi:hypothetical protein